MNNLSENLNITETGVKLKFAEFAVGIEQIFTDADSWNRNVRKKGEEKINPDPNGEMAKQWLNLFDDAIELSARFKPFMEKHFKQFGKPKTADTGEE